jgi:hypothetical protein
VPNEASRSGEVLSDEQVEVDRRGPPRLGRPARRVAAMVPGRRGRFVPSRHRNRVRSQGKNCSLEFRRDFPCQFRCRRQKIPLPRASAKRIQVHDTKWFFDD